MPIPQGLDNKPLIDIDDGDDVGQEGTATQRAFRRMFKSAAELAKLLPTGTVLTFQVLAPVLTNQGNCHAANKIVTAALLAFCGFCCFILCFTDSFRDPSGRVRYGLATCKGLYVNDGLPLPPSGDMVTYRIKAIDFGHAFMSLLVFAAVALLDKNVVSCFYPIPSVETKLVFTALPIAIGALGSTYFLSFPTRRNGIGFPLSALVNRASIR